MSNQTLDQVLINMIRKHAKSKSREDKSKSHQQWLNHFSREYGHSWESLIDRVATLEIAMSAERHFAAEEAWISRLMTTVWGEIPRPDEHMLPLPIEEGAATIPWPNCFLGNHIFCPRTAEPHEFVSGPVFNIDEEVIEFHGEQLWTTPDSIVFASLIVMSRGLPTGAIIDFTSTELESVTGQSPSAFDTPSVQHSFQKSLWRLTHGILVFERYGFKGPMLVFVDISKSPERFRVAFNPDFAKFYYPQRPMIQRVKVATKDGLRLPWCENLTTYLAGRARHCPPFRFGDWLETLVANDLSSLSNYLVDSDEGKSSVAEDDDILSVVMLATSIETSRHDADFNIKRIQELFDVFRLAVSFEGLKRLGLIVVPRAIALSSQEELSFQLTEAGMVAGLNLHHSPR